MRPVSAVKRIKCPICLQTIQACDLVYHAEREVRPRTVKQSMKALMDLSKGLKLSSKDYERIVDAERYE